MTGMISNSLAIVEYKSMVLGERMLERHVALSWRHCYQRTGSPIGSILEKAAILPPADAKRFSNLSLARL